MHIDPPIDVACPTQAQPARTPSLATRALRLFQRLRVALLGTSRIREVPIGHPEAFADRPGERRIILGHKVLIITKR